MNKMTILFKRRFCSSLKTQVENGNNTYTGVERNDEIRLIYLNLRKITFYLGGKIS
jgi:hypothetical protein